MSVCLLIVLILSNSNYLNNGCSEECSYWTVLAPFMYVSSVIFVTNTWLKFKKSHPNLVSFKALIDCLRN